MVSLKVDINGLFKLSPVAFFVVDLLEVGKAFNSLISFRTVLLNNT